MLRDDVTGKASVAKGYGFGGEHGADPVEAGRFPAGRGVGW